MFLFYKICSIVAIDIVENVSSVISREIALLLREIVCFDKKIKKINLMN